MPCPTIARLSTLALLFSLLAPATATAQLDEPEATCFEPVKPACAEVTVGQEDEGWATRCLSELEAFLEDLSEYRQCVDGRLEQMQERAEAEKRQMECVIDEEAEDC